MSTARLTRAEARPPAPAASPSSRRRRLVVVGASPPIAPLSAPPLSLPRRRRRAVSTAAVARVAGSATSPSSSSRRFGRKRSRAPPLVAASTRTAVGGADGDDAPGQSENGSGDDSPPFFAGAPDAALAGSPTSSSSASDGTKGGGSAAGATASAGASSSASTSPSPLPSAPLEALEIVAASAAWFYEYLRWGPNGKAAKKGDRLKSLREAVDGVTASADERRGDGVDASPRPSSPSSDAFSDLLEELVRAREYDEVISRVSSDPERAPSPLPPRAAASYLEALVASGRLRSDFVLPRGAPEGAALLPAPGNEHASLPALLSDLSDRVVGGEGKGKKVPPPGRSPSRPLHVAVYAPTPSTSTSAGGARGASLLSSSAAPSPSTLGTVVGSLVSSLAMLLGLGALFVMGAGVARRHAASPPAPSAAAQQQQQQPSQPGAPRDGGQGPYGGGFPGSSSPLQSGPSSSQGYAPKEFVGEDVPEHSKVKFDDVKGVDEAKAELAEVVDFLKSPSKFRALGGKLPKGVLLTGPPGTGKTMLARAVAGEAGVPFFFRAGSEFEEMFVGVGARRARALFAAARKAAPCIVFIDEIDAVGGNRRAWENHSRKTLNQLLVEMDGFEPTEGVIVVAATNAADTLDPALVRPGRFDRQVAVPLPDVRGRLEILTHYLKSKPLARDEAEAAARATDVGGGGAATGEGAEPTSAAGGRLLPSLQQQQSAPPPLPWGRGSIFGGSGGGGPPSSAAPLPSPLSPTSSASSSTPPPPPPLQTVDLPLLAGTIARRTPGFSGAQLASMVNEAALLAARRSLGALTPQLLDEARDKVLMGTERRSLVQSRVNRKLTAYHEAGHALVASLTDGARPIHKATIVPRGHALGMVAQLPDGDETSVSRRQLRAEVDVALGGMAAEALVFGSDGVTTGARSDLKQATRVARHMIAECGMSDAVGPRFVSSPSESSSSSADPDTARLVDAEVGAFLREARERVAALLKQRERDLHRLAGALLEHETLTGDDVAAVLAGTFDKAPPVGGGGSSGGNKEEREMLAALGVDVDGIGEMARKKR